MASWFDLAMSGETVIHTTLTHTGALPVVHSVLSDEPAFLEDLLIWIPASPPRIDLCLLYAATPAIFLRLDSAAKQD